MSLLSEIWRKVRLQLNRDTFEQELEEEMRFHLEQVIEENIRAGMDSVDAEHAARRRFGEPLRLQEQSRREWQWPRLENLLRDISFSLRIMRRRPGFVVAAVLSIGLGVGVNTTIFTFADSLFSRPISGVERPEELTSIYQRSHGGDGSFTSFSWPGYEYFRDRNRLFTDVGAIMTMSMTVRSGDNAATVPAGLISANFFEVLGIDIELGSTIRATDDRTPGENSVVVLSHRFWMTSMAGDRSVIGRQLRIGDGFFTVIGVVSSDFRGLEAEESESPQLWLPVESCARALPSMASSGLMTNWGSHNFTLLARSQSGTSLDQINAEVLRLGDRIGQDHPERAAIWPADMAAYGDLVPVVFPSNRARFWPGNHEEVRQFIGLISIIAVLVLLMGCLNMANLLLLRAAHRRTEMAVRLTLGAGRFRMVTQILTENFLIVFLGGAVALLFASWTTGVLSTLTGISVGILPSGSVMDPRTMIFTLTLVTVIAIVLSLLPIRAVLRTGISPTIKIGSGSGGYRGFRMHDLLVASQIVLSLVLLIGAGLSAETLRNALSADVTVEPEQVLTTRLDPRSAGLDRSTGYSYYEQLLARTEALPAVRSASLVLVVPLGGRRGGTNLRIGGDGPVTGAGEVQVGFNVITPDYFSTIGIPLLQGRDISTSDHATSSPVVVINEEMARRFFPDGSAIGRPVTLVGGTERSAMIVGIVRDGSFRNYRSEIEPTVYVPLAQDYQDRMNLEVRFEGASRAVIPALLTIMGDIDDRVSPAGMETLADRMKNTLRQERLLAAVLTLLGILALLLAAIGIYGILSYRVAESTSEIGIRIAVGARPGEIMHLVMRRVLFIMACGSAAGVLLAFVFGRIIRSLLFDVSPGDPGIMLGSIAILMIVAFAAGWIPARRASRVDPIRALRND
ncbi:ADOP family duplicated permease [Gemmatimonadota bacterium]